MSETRRIATARGPVLRMLCSVRAGVGLARVAFPDTVLPGLAATPLPSHARLVVRLLGARQIVQGVVTRREPTRTVLCLGAAVDAAHAASMVGLAFDRRYRRTALADAGIATAFAFVGIVVAATA